MSRAVDTLKTLRPPALLCTLALTSAQALADWGWDAGARFAYDDNLSNGLESDDRAADTAAVVEGSAGFHRQLGASTGVGVDLVADSATYFRYAGLSNTGLGASAQVRSKFGLGGGAPWLALSGRAVHRNYHYDYRDGWQYEGGATLGKQVSERWALRGSARYDAFVADDVKPPGITGKPGGAYDTFGWNLGAQATWLATEADLFSLSYTWRNGTVTAVTQPDFEILAHSDRVAVDTVFGSSPRRIAYRIKAHSQMASLIWSHALGRHSAFNVSYGYRISRAQPDLGDYASNLIGVSLTYAY
jgi:hypothetical protein